MGRQVVTTHFGKVRGAEVDGVTAFLGLAYAAPPIGKLRLRPPTPPKPWRGIRDAGSFGPIAPQPSGGLGSYIPGDPTAQSEDCLTLNIWTPDVEGCAPVMVYVHGGAFISGSGSGVMYRGAPLARRGVVVVTFNYRLGALGFLADPSLADDESSGFGNWGLLDQIAALGFVCDEIEAFGGDPTNVTVFGESAGAMAIGDLLLYPPERPLFKRAILQSGAPVADAPSQAAVVAATFARALGVTTMTRGLLERAPLEAIASAQLELLETGVGGVMPFRPVLDGGVLSHATVTARAFDPSLEILAGTNRDEFKFFSSVLSHAQPIAPQRLEELVEDQINASSALGVRPAATEVIEHYRRARAVRGDDTAERELLDAIGTDLIFRVPTLDLLDRFHARGHATFAYEFAWRSPFAGGTLGACHGLELPFVFQSLDNIVVAVFAGSSTEAKQLADAIGQAWTSFARSGDPSCDALGHWPRYEPSMRVTMELASVAALSSAPRDDERRFWLPYLSRYGDTTQVEDPMSRSATGT